MAMTDRSLLLISLALFVVAGCDKDNGSAEDDPIVGEWAVEGGGPAVSFEADGTITPSEHEDSSLERCRAAGFAEVVEECATGHWEASDEGYDLELPGIDVMQSGDPGASIECRCGPTQVFPAKLEGDSLEIDMVAVEGPVVRLRRR